LAGAGKIGISVGKAIGKYKMGKHFHITITDTTFTYHRDTAGIDAEAELDGIYVLRTSSGGKLQEPRQRRTRLAHHQDRRPGPAPHPPPPRRTGPRARADLPARLLPGLAPTQGLGTNDIHRRTPPPAGKPRRGPAAFTPSPRQDIAQARRRQQ